MAFSLTWKNLYIILAVRLGRDELLGTKKFIRVVDTADRQTDREATAGRVLREFRPQHPRETTGI